MKRLFMLVSVDGKKAHCEQSHDVRYFENKMEAKKLRDEYNEAVGHPKWRVSKAPDHIKFIK